ncbi:flagellar biosynthesis regulator FlaF [Paracoccus pacificus]|uniref:Flagellar biosynthesis regulator FlaF n=1 Tax=Paracoccus pacificus TaxID=1463598 RepID=A0ABW4R6E7_9RHOB
MNAAVHHEPNSRFGVTEVRTDRDNEYEAFARATRQLQRAQAENDPQQQVRAVHTNSHLWTILANDLSNPGNMLPDQVKAGLLSLALFSVRHGLKVMNQGAEISSLIDVNLTIMRGLRGEGGRS